MSAENVLDRIKQTREQRQLTQMDVAKALGFESHVAYNLIENGERRLTLDTFLKIAATLRVSPSALLGETDGEATLAELLATNGLDQEETEMLELFRQIPGELGRRYIKDNLASFLRMIKK